MRYSFFIWMLLVSGWASAQSQVREVFMCKDATLRIRAESTGAVRYEWFLDNQVITGTSAAELLVKNEGTYKAVGVNADGCESGESVYIVVKHHNPSAVDDIALGKVNTPLVIDVLKNDLSECAAFNPTSLAVVQSPASGTVTSANGLVTYTPDRDFKGQVTIGYTVSDQAGQLSNIAQVKVDIVSDPLPVTLAYFEVEKKEAMALVEWQSTEEIHTAHFDVQRSTDAREWRMIGKMDAAGESNTGRNYTFTDSIPEPGLNYYRLKMVDTDSSFAFSGIRSVSFPDFSWAEVYPNPVDDLLRIVVRNRKVSNIRMISHSGIVMLSRPVTSPALTISMRHYPIGMYYIHFEQADGAVKIFKLMHN
ncbi:Ig-like domain-containing protein [Dyadobacter jiangsuensis]|uniref:Putative secreted protein (Por secretion system target) n=1 Tax=Dyadobacter jiangsuensis TaxID=1591085 RepID=A0A2P8G846_9BACT|nr:Ig-like domain-containing protein [Dyadobacter jiangsuensis]PSL30152.1 putative secreted protein (Por secretion system target) [Dyadobacter jiangsuensis]